MATNWCLLFDINNNNNQDSRFKIHSKIHPYSFEGVLQIVNLRLQLKYMELKIVHTYK